MKDFVREYFRHNDVKMLDGSEAVDGLSESIGVEIIPRPFRGSG